MGNQDLQKMHQDWRREELSAGETLFFLTAGTRVIVCQWCVQNQINVCVSLNRNTEACSLQFSRFSHKMYPFAGLNPSFVQHSCSLVLAQHRFIK